MKDYLKKLLAKRKAKLTKLQERSNVSESIEEVRSIGTEIDDLNEEIRDIEAQLQSLDDVEAQRGAGAPLNANANPQFNPIATYGLGADGQRSNTSDDLEYRNAFMANVLHNTPIPQELRANESTLTADVTSVIPTILTNQILERMENLGMIIPLVTHTNYSAGVVIPTSNVKPVATWVAEGQGSDRQKKSTGKITFAYFKLRCEISMSMEVGTMALSAFEAKFVENVAKAMVIAQEKAILNGDGTAQPKGILKETPIATIAINKDAPTYANLCDIEALVPVEFEATAKYFMTKAQFMKFMGMVDTNGQPIARVTYGISARPEYMLMGRGVVIHPYATEMGANIAGIVDFADYVLNKVYDMGISKKQDWDTEDLLTKAVMSVDGKLIDNGSLITITHDAG